MHWWAILYILILAAVGVAVTRHNRDGREAAWFVLGDLLAVAAMVLFVADYDGSRRALGRGILILFPATLAWEVFTWVRELRKSRADPSPTPLEAAISLAGSILGAFALTAPALLAGASLFRPHLSPMHH